MYINMLKTNAKCVRNLASRATMPYMEKLKSMFIEPSAFPNFL